RPARRWRIRCRKTYSIKAYSIHFSRTYWKRRSRQRRALQNWSSIPDSPVSTVRRTWSRSSASMFTSRNTEISQRQTLKPRGRRDCYERQHSSVEPFLTRHIEIDCKHQHYNKRKVSSRKRFVGPG